MTEHTITRSNFHLEKWKMHVYVLGSDSQGCVQQQYSINPTYQI